MFFLKMKKSCLFNIWDAKASESFLYGDAIASKSQFKIKRKKFLFLKLHNAHFIHSGSYKKDTIYIGKYLWEPNNGNIKLQMLFLLLKKSLHEDKICIYNSVWLHRMQYIIIMLKKIRQGQDAFKKGSS